jgi:hypothetical protein
VPKENLVSLSLQYSYLLLFPSYTDTGQNFKATGTDLHGHTYTDKFSTLCTDHPEIPQRTGKLLSISKFDASFFGVHFKQAHTMDPMCRMLLERTYEAIVDAGQ